MVNLKKCKGKSYCKSEQEIIEFTTNHYFFIAYNDQDYNPDNFEDDKTIVKTLKAESFPLF